MTKKEEKRREENYFLMQLLKERVKNDAFSLAIIDQMEKVQDLIQLKK